MNKRLLATCLALTGALLATGCANFGLIRAAEQARPQVTVVNGRIAVSPETLVFTRANGATRIQWSLPRDSALRFPADGIVIEGELSSLVGGKTTEVKDPRQRDMPTSTPVNRSQKEVVDCKPSPDFKEFSCLNRNTRAGIYKYTIRVIDGSRTLQLDPPIINMN